MNILYLDESGDHDLINIDPDYPIFVLAGSVIAKDYHNNNLTRRMNQFKQDIFSDNDIILHYADYTRNKSGFERMISKEFREKFYSGLNTIIQTTEVSVYACIIDKKRHVESYKYPINPYTYSLEVIVEKFVMDLNRANKQGMIIAESRGSQFDNELNLAYLNLKISGTRFLKASEVNNRIGNDFYIKKKVENIAGLQLTDSFATPIGRKYLGLKNYYLDYEVIKSKFQKHACGRIKGYGLVILPNK